MLPMEALRLKLGELLAANVATLAAATANKVALVAAAFTKSETLVVGDLTLATFTGSAPKSGASGAQQAGVDPVTGAQVITILTPAGGWRWECTTTPGSPETIFGYALINDAGDTLLGVETLTTPVAITQAGEFIDLGAVQIFFVSQPMA